MAALLAVVAALAGACGAASPAGAANPAPGFIRFSAQDMEGNFIPIGEVEFCLNGNGGCIYADIERGFPGHFTLNSRDLVPGRTYTVMIYTMDVRVIYEMRDWTWVPEDYDRGWDKVLDCEKFLVYPRFHGDEERMLSFEVDATLNPVWEERAGSAFTIEAPDPLQFPDFIFAAQAVSQAGAHFGTDPDAAGGVTAASPGWQLTATWRHHYPERHRWDQGWVTCRELSFSYGQNRYETASVMAPGRVGDVTFHRFELAYGIARMNQSQINHYGIAALVSYGGIYDGREVLTFNDRRYRLVGVGLRAHYRKMILSGGGLEVGGVIEASAVYYPADAGDDDFWYGLAPMLSLGMVVF